jgi:hypothetical protein
MQTQAMCERFDKYLFSTAAESLVSSFYSGQEAFRTQIISTKLYIHEELVAGTFFACFPGMLGAKFNLTRHYFQAPGKEKLFFR